MVTPERTFAVDSWLKYYTPASIFAELAVAGFTDVDIAVSWPTGPDAAGDKAMSAAHTALLVGGTGRTGARVLEQLLSCGRLPLRPRRYSQFVHPVGDRSP